MSSSAVLSCAVNRCRTRFRHAQVTNFLIKRVILVQHPNLAHNSALCKYGNFSSENGKAMWRTELMKKTSTNDLYKL